MACWQTFDKLMPRYCCKNTLAHMGALPASGTLRAAWETPAICWPRTADCIHVPCELASCPSPRRFNSAWVLPLRLLQVGKNINTRKHSEHMWLGLTWPCCLHVWVSETASPDLILGSYINACLHCSRNTVAFLSSRRQLLDPIDIEFSLHGVTHSQVLGTFRVECDPENIQKNNRKSL